MWPGSRSVRAPQPPGTRRHRFVVTTILWLLALTIPLHSQTGGEPDQPDVDSTVVLFDTTDILDPYAPSGSDAGGPFVDSVFFEGRMIRLAVRIADEIRRDTVRLRALIDSLEESAAARLAANLRLDPDEWRPTASDIEMRDEMIRRAQDKEYIYGDGTTYVPLMEIPLQSIGQALGLVEDTSPRIAYSLSATRAITVIVYTLDALEIRRIVDASQRPGEYRFDWDFLDANGRKVLPGSYIVEVIADETEMLLRKRIVVP